MNQTTTDDPADTRRALRDLLAARSARRGEVTLSTGAKSNFYFDCKKVTLSADGAWLVGTAFLDALDQLPERPAAVGGLADGANPIVSAMIALSHVRKRPVQGFYVRKAAKQHGTKRRIENAPEPGTRVVIVDDVVTSGGSLLQAVQAARDAGCEVVGALALVDRDEQDGASRIRAEVGTYLPLYRRSDFPRIAGVADPSDAAATSGSPAKGSGAAASAA